MNRNLISFVLIAASLAAQNLTPAQKEADFRALASVHATFYAPLDWKKELVGFDARDLKPWLAKVAATKTDLEFYEVCVEYIAGLQDSHVSFVLPSDFSAQLGFVVDVYEDALLIDSINRTLLPLATYPFGIGDELVSIDGVDARQVLAGLMKYVPQGNEKAQKRQAAQRLTSRAQSRFPHAPSLGEMATVVIKRQNGASESYTLKWVKTGTPLIVGPVPSPITTTGREKVNAAAGQDYMRSLREFQFSGVTDKDVVEGVLNYGSRTPIFVNGLGSGFTRRLGGQTADFFYSGTFKRDELTLGYIRIPNYSPPSQVQALQQLEAEITYMNANTDGLIIDEMRNTGGNLCFGQEVARRLIPYKFEATGFATRPFWSRVVGFYNSMISAKASGASQEIIDQYETIYAEISEAAREGRITKPMPLCGPSLTREPWTDASGKVLAYSKPIMVLIDEFSTSTADSFASMMQDAGRGLLYGYRTNGAGGNNISLNAGVYSEAMTGATIALQTRRMRANPGYPSSIYTENVGVHPDFTDDYMTRENLLRGGARYVGDFLEAMAAYTREHK